MVYEHPKNCGLSASGRDLQPPVRVCFLPVSAASLRCLQQASPKDDRRDKAFTTQTAFTISVITRWQRQTLPQENARGSHQISKARFSFCGSRVAAPAVDFRRVYLQRLLLFHVFTSLLQHPVQSKQRRIKGRTEEKRGTL
jgi:hypothetical protein